MRWKKRLQAAGRGWTAGPRPRSRATRSSPRWSSGRSTPTLEALVAPCAELGGHSPGGCGPGGPGPQPPTERGREALELKPPAQVSSGAARSRPQPTAGLGDQGWYQRSLVLSVQVHTTSWVPLRVE